MAETLPASKPPIWLFDSVCVLCDGAVQFTLRHEKAPTIRFVSIQSDEGRALAVDHDVDPDNPETFLFLENGIAYPKSDGVIALARYLKAPMRFAVLGRFVPRALRDWAYTWVARHRYRIFGRHVTCIIPDPAHRHRFTL